MMKDPCFSDSDGFLVANDKSTLLGYSPTASPNIKMSNTMSTFLTKGKIPSTLEEEIRPHAICLGRVKDLESNVPEQWWKTVFADSMYLKTDGDCVEDPRITQEEIQLLKNDPEINSIFHMTKPHGQTGMS